MENSNKDIENAIINFLSSNKDQVKNLIDIYNELKRDTRLNLDDEEFKERNLFKISTLCDNLNKKNDKIYKSSFNNKYVFTNNLKKNIFNLDCDDKTNKHVNYDNIVKDIIKNPTEYTFLHINNFLDGKKNALHFCSEYSDSNYLEKLLLYYNVDLNIKSKDNKTGLEIALEKNLAKNVDILNKYKYEEVNNNMKQINKKLQSDYNSLVVGYNNLQKLNVQKTNFLISLWTLFVSIFIIFQKSNLFISFSDYLSPIYAFIFITLFILQLFLDKLFIFKIKSFHLLILTFLTVPICYYNQIIYFLNQINQIKFE